METEVNDFCYWNVNILSKLLFGRLYSFKPNGFWESYKYIHIPFFMNRSFSCPKKKPKKTTQITCSERIQVEKLREE